MTKKDVSTQPTSFLDEEIIFFGLKCNFLVNLFGYSTG